VRKASEAVDDGFVPQCKIEIVRIAEGGEQLDGARLIGRIFRVLEGYVNECPLVGLKPHIHAFGDGSLGERKRLSVGGEGARIAAKHVPGKLIEHEDRGEPTLGQFEPILRHRNA
jgi:hypothetical protein